MSGYAPARSGRRARWSRVTVVSPLPRRPGRSRVGCPIVDHAGLSSWIIARNPRYGRSVTLDLPEGITMSSTIRISGGTVFVTVPAMNVDLADTLNFEAPANWAACARSYYRSNSTRPEGHVQYVIAGALRFVAQGDNDLAIASLYQALTMIKDAVAAQQATTVDDMLRLAGLLAPVGWDKPNTSPATEGEARS